MYIFPPGENPGKQKLGDLGAVCHMPPRCPHVVPCVQVCMLQQQDGDEEEEEQPIGNYADLLSRKGWFVRRGRTMIGSIVYSVVRPFFTSSVGCCLLFQRHPR